MRKNNTQSISEVLREYVNALKLNPKFKEIHAVKLWSEMLGKGVERASRKVYIKNGVLFVHLDSSVVRAELMMMREQIRQAMNKKIGEEYIKEIVLK